MHNKQLTLSNLLFWLDLGGVVFFFIYFKKRRYDLEQTGFIVPSAMHAQLGQVKEELLRTWHGPLRKILIAWRSGE